MIVIFHQTKIRQQKTNPPKEPSHVRTYSTVRRIHLLKLVPTYVRKPGIGHQKYPTDETQHGKPVGVLTYWSMSTLYVVVG